MTSNPDTISSGGADAIARLFVHFYERAPDNPVLAPVFAAIHPHRAARVAAFVGEVLGREMRCYDAGGSHADTILRHVGRHLTEEQRRA
jgi:hemoglobin